MLAGGLAAFALLAGGTTAAQAATISFDNPTVTNAETNADHLVALAVTTSCGLLETGSSSFDIVLTPGTATTPADFTSPASPASVSVSCIAGLGGGASTVNVGVKGDTLDENDETFTAKAVAPSAPATALTTSTVTITDDDNPPVITLGTPTAAVEGTSAVGPGLSFPVSLSTASGRSLSVTYSTADGTATQPGDYLPASGTLTIPAGQTTASIPVGVNADPIDEDDETLTLTIANPTNVTLGAVGTRTATGTITDDDTSTISMAGAAVNEGAAGTTTVANATVSLSTPSAKTVTVNYATSPGSATAGEDYVTTTGTVTFLPGQTTGTIPITVNGDGAVEPDELFGITLSSPTNATITLGTAVMTIKNDDTAPAGGGGTTTGGGTTGGGTTTTGGGTTTVPGGVTIDPGKTSTLPPITTTVSAPIRLGKLSYKKATGTLRYDVTCPDAAGSCKGTVTVFTVPVAKSRVKALRKEQKLGSKKFTLAAGQTVSLNVKLSKAAKGWLKAAKTYKVIAYAVASTTKAGVSTAKTTGAIKK